MTFAEGVMRLVGIGARDDEAAVTSPSAASPSRSPRTSEAAAALSPAAAPPSAGAAALPAAAAQEASDVLDEPTAASAAGIHDLEASVALVVAGVASSVTLTGFPSWPGLLWRAYQLAEEWDVTILPTVVRPGGRVDIVITRSGAPGE